MRSKVIIIGGGLSGTLAAIQLAQFPGGPDVLMIEKNPDDEPISILDFGTRKTVVLASGNALHADEVILALGNFPPADLFLQNNPLQNDPRYDASPWSDKVYSHIAGDENMLLIGSGLTAVDIVLGLGIKCTPEGRIINEQDKIEEGLWCIGPMRKAVLWEITALRELREQASELASLIVEKQ